MVVSKERDVEEIYEQLRELEEQKEKDTLTRAPINVKTWLAILMGFIILGILFKFIDLKVGVIIAIVILVIIKFLFGDVQKREFTEQELAIILYKKLRYKQIFALGKFYQISPQAVIQIEKIGRRVRINGIPQERIYGVSIYDPRTQIKEWYRYIVDLRTGDITGCRKLSAGFIDLEDWDVKVVESEGLRDRKLVDKALGYKSPRKRTLENE